MNPYILHALSDHSKDEERLKILNHTPYLFKNFYSLLTTIESPSKGGFMFIKDHPNYNWNGGLSCACLGGNLDIVNLMIEKGATYFDWGLEGACSGGHLNLVNLMIEKEANGWNGGLSCACLGGNLDIVNLMIEKGATRCYKCFQSMEEHLRSIQKP